MSVFLPNSQPTTPSGLPGFPLPYGGGSSGSVPGLATPGYVPPSLGQPTNTGGGFSLGGLKGAFGTGLMTEFQKGGNILNVAKAGITAGASYLGGVAAGTALGSVVPGIGNVVGAIVGAFASNSLKGLDDVVNNGGDFSCWNTANSPAKARERAPQMLKKLVALSGAEHALNAESLNKLLLLLNGYAAAHIKERENMSRCTKEGDRELNRIFKSFAGNIEAEYAAYFNRLGEKVYRPGEFRMTVDGDTYINKEVEFRTPVYGDKSFGQSLNDALTPGMGYNPVGDTRYGNLPYAPVEEDNTLLYIGIGVLAYMFLKKK